MIRDGIKENENFIEENKADLAASLQKAIIDTLMAKLKRAVKETGITEVAIAGGVSANKGLRNRLEELSEKHQWKLFIPPFEYCTDNAAMIAWAGYEKYFFEGETDLNFQPRPRWPLDPDTHSNHPIFKTVGKKGVKA